MPARTILTRFTFPDADAEFDFRLWKVKRTCYNTLYPFGVLSAKGLDALEFEPLTVLYGGNGSGKTTCLNVIAEKLGLQRDSLYNRSNFFGDYIDMCRFETACPVPRQSRIITSDDVFDFMLDLRAMNEGIDRKREELFDEYLENKRERDFRLRSLDDYDELKRINTARSKTQSKYVRQYLPDNAREQSNGESAYAYFTDRIREGTLCLLDEPENSLSPALQIALSDFVRDSARFYGCQFVIATHSPFFLAINGAKVYDLDADPPRPRKWTELESVRTYYNFFAARKDEFEKS